MIAFEIRGAAPGDARFLGDMLVEAVNGNAPSARSRMDVLQDAQVSRYVVGWKRPGDLGSIAVDAAGAPIGACWARLYTAETPGTGFIAPGVPELTLGVSQQWRAEGVGRALLKAVERQAAAAGHARLSLSVGRSNHARRLYISEGYVTVRAGSRAEVMQRSVGLG